MAENMALDQPESGNTGRKAVSKARQRRPVQKDGGKAVGISQCGDGASRSPQRMKRNRASRTVGVVESKVLLKVVEAVVQANFVQKQIWLMRKERRSTGRNFPQL